MKNKNQRSEFVINNKKIGLFAVVMKFAVIELILVALLQFGFYKIDSIPLFKDDPGLRSDTVTVDDMVSTGSSYSYLLY